MRRAATAFLLALFITTPARSEDANASPLPAKLIIGVVAFNKKNQAPTIDPMLQAYLDSVTKEAERQGTDLHFDVVRGNYYQVLRWMRDGTIDGALLSPFTYHVLRDDMGPIDSRALLPLATFLTTGVPTNDGELDGNAPMFRALKNGQPTDDPDRVLKECVEQLGTAKNPCNFAFVNHLSTTGFLYPLLRIHQDVGPPRFANVVSQLLEHTRFILWHKEIPTEGTQLQFTYAYSLLGRAKDAGEEIRAYVTEKKWKPLLPEKKAFADDLLVLSGVSSRAKSVRVKFADASSIWSPESIQKPALPSEYDRVIPFNGTDHQELADDIDDIKSADAMQPLWERWYVNEQFEFTLPELVDVLKNDQLLGGRERVAAIVLPGGGVRGAYQAVILDALYKGDVANIHARDENKEQLIVSSIVGTSGGALMGYFAARKPTGTPLEQRWIKNQQVAIEPHHVFPWVGAMRWLSVLACVAIFTFWITLGWAKPRTDVHFHRGVPFVLCVAIAVVLFGTPFLVKQLVLHDIGVSDLMAAAFYVGFVVVTHAVHSVIEPSMRARSPFWLVLGTIAICGGGLCAWYAVGPASLSLAAGGLILVMGGLFAVARGFGMFVSEKEVHGYAKGIALLAAFLAGTLLLFWIVLLSDGVTSVELTGEYWLVLGIAASVMAFAVLFAHKVPPVKDALLFWFRVTHAKPLFYTPMVTLLVAGFTGIVSWVVFVAPALYNGNKGAKTFAQQANAVPHAATADFVAALTNLGTPPCKNGDCPKETDRFAPGDYYAVLCETVDCESRLAPLPRFLVYRPKERDEFLEAVSASGSPFPIYHARPLSRVDKKVEKKGMFIDGGYTHLVPVEGAVRLGAKQVLIVANRPYDEPESRSRLQSTMSLLVSDLPRTASFLFDRAQVADHMSQKDVVVATIAPTSNDDVRCDDLGITGKINPAPFLMDFRPKTIRGLVCKARTDVAKQRPGRIASWGPPNVFLVSAHQRGRS